MAAPAIRGGASGDDSTKELVDRCGNLIRMRLEREVAGVEQGHSCVRIIGAVGLSTWWQKEGIVLAPDGEQRRFALAEVALELRIEYDVRRVVTAKQLTGLGPDRDGRNLVER
jgi:hypothetical protein